LDHLTTELTEKLVKALPGFQAQYLIPTKLLGLDAATVAYIYRHNGNDVVEVQSLEKLGIEMNRWRMTWRDIVGAPPDIVTTLDACNSQFFPGIYSALKPCAHIQH